MWASGRTPSPVAQPPQGFSHRPTSRDRIAAAPKFEALDIGRTAGLRPVRLRDARFVVDVSLGRLARLLRVLGGKQWAVVARAGDRETQLAPQAI